MVPHELAGFVVADVRRVRRLVDRSVRDRPPSQANASASAAAHCPPRSLQRACVSRRQHAGCRLIALTDTVYETVMQALLDSGSPLAIRAIGQLRLPALE